LRAKEVDLTPDWFITARDSLFCFGHNVNRKASTFGRVFRSTERRRRGRRRRKKTDFAHGKLKLKVSDGIIWKVMQRLKSTVEEIRCKKKTPLQCSSYRKKNEQTVL